MVKSTGDRHESWLIGREDAHGYAEPRWPLDEDYCRGFEIGKLNIKWAYGSGPGTLAGNEDL